MCRVDKDKLCNKIADFKYARDKRIKPIQKEYQGYIDDIIFKEIPFKCGDIIKDKLGDQVRYFIYKGIKKENMVLYGCDKEGIENSEDRQYHWTIYDDFEVHKKSMGHDL